MKLAPTIRRATTLAIALTVGCGTSAAQSPSSPDSPPASEARAASPPNYDALPTPGSIVEWTPPSVDTHELSNGLTVWYLRQEVAPLVYVALLLPKGSTADPEGKEGLGLLTADMLDEGAGDLSALQLSEELGKLATDYHSQINLDQAMLSMSGLAENFEPSLELLAKIVREPRLPGDEFSRRLNHHIASAMSSLDDQGARADAALHRVLFRNGYGGDPERGSVQSLKNITLADVQQHAKLMTVPDGAHLVVAGNVPKQKVMDAAQRLFGSWSGKNTPVSVPVAEPMPAKTAYVVDFPGAAQSSLLIARRAGPAEDPRYFSELVMNEKLGGSFVSRINMNLREDKGYTYGAFTVFQRYLEAGYFAASTSVRSDATAASVREIFAEFQAICREKPLSARELEESIEGLLLGYPMKFERVDETGLRLASLPMLDRPQNFWTTWPDEIESVDLAQANAAAKPYCNPDNYRVIIAGDLDSNRAGLEELGLRIVELDKFGNPVAAGAEEEGVSAQRGLSREEQ